jgi:hypothetical protein
MPMVVVLQLRHIELCGVESLGEKKADQSYCVQAQARDLQLAHMSLCGAHP